MASRNVLLGMVPVCTQTPPMVRLRSMMATFLRSLAAQIAAFWPAGPLPITTRSYSLASIIAVNGETITPAPRIEVTLGNLRQFNYILGVEAVHIPARVEHFAG